MKLYFAKTIFSPMWAPMFLAAVVRAANEQEALLLLNAYFCMENAFGGDVEFAELANVVSGTPKVLMYQQYESRVAFDKASW